MTHTNVLHHDDHVLQQRPRTRDADVRPFQPRETAVQTPAPKAVAPNALWYFIPVDFLALCVGFLAACDSAAVVNEILLGRMLPSPFSSGGNVGLMQSAAIACGVLLWFAHTNHYRTRMPFWQEAQKVVQTLGCAAIIDGFFHFASKQDISRLWLLGCWGFAAAAILILRAAMRARLCRQGHWALRCLLVGAGTTADETESALESEPRLGYEVTARIDNLPYAFAKGGHTWDALIRAHNVDHVIVALDGDELSRAEHALTQLAREDIPFSISPPVQQLPILGMETYYFFNHDVALMVRTNPLDHLLPQLIKRGFDIAVASFLLAMLGLPMLAIAWLVRRDGAPALFCHPRTGLNGKMFGCFKFRSMIANSAEVLRRHLEENPALRAEWQRTCKLHNDPRVTRTGAFLRRMSLDELPQLLNVLKGDMSLVGPRPITTEEHAHYGADMVYYRRVRPGITGMWQVSGRSDTSYRRRVQIDRWYVRNWSLWHDLAILCKTLPAVMNRSGAY